MGNAVCRKKPKDGKINFTPIPGTDLGETPNQSNNNNTLKEKFKYKAQKFDEFYSDFKEKNPGVIVSEHFNTRSFIQNNINEVLTTARKQNKNLSVPAIVEDEEEEFDPKHKKKVIARLKKKILTVKNDQSINQSRIKTERMSGMTSYISEATKRSLMESYFDKPNNDLPAEAYIPGMAHYDRVINKNVQPQGNKILDDSVIDSNGGSQQAKQVLIESGKVDNCKYAIWNSGHEESQYLTSNGQLFVDDTFEFDLNRMKETLEEDITPKRISEISHAMIFDTAQETRSWVYEGKSQVISLIAALSGISHFEELKRLKLMDNIIYPQKLLHGSYVNPAGRYGLKFHFNGTRRMVDIDDHVLFFENYDDDDEVMEQLLGIQTKNPREFWPALLEKAICKLYSSKTMVIHSNPSMMVFHITGWMPEIIEITEDTNIEYLWQRIIQNYNDDNILINLETKEYDPTSDFGVNEYKLGKFRHQNTNIELNYYYNVIKLVDLEKVRLLLMKNPVGSNHARTYDPLEFDEYTNKKILDALDWPEDELNSNGISIAIWDDILKYCSAVHLNWSPSVYHYHTSVHSKRLVPEGMYDPASVLWNHEYCIENMPQVVLKIPPHEEDFEVRIVFERHITSFQKSRDKFLISYQLYPYYGDRIITPHNALKTHNFIPRSTLSDTFIFEASAEEENYILVLLCYSPDEQSQNIESQTFNFSIHAYSFVKINLIELPFRLIKQREVMHGRWGDNSAGGNILSPNFLTNPKYVMTVNKRDDFQFKVEGPQDASLMIVIIPVGDLDLTKNPLSKTSFKNFLNLNPGFYFDGMSSYKVTLKPDTYVVLLSNQNKRIGQYRLYVDSLSSQLGYHKVSFASYPKPEERFSIQDFPEFKMKYTTTLNGEWNKSNSKGTYRIDTQDYQGIMKNPGYLLEVHDDIKVRLHLKSAKYIEDYENAFKSDPESTYQLEPPSLSVAVYELLGGNKFKLILEDDHYAPAAWGYQSREMHLMPNIKGYLILCLNYEKGYEGKYQLLVQSNQRLDGIKDSSKIMKLKHQYNINGEWKENSAGGCMSEVSFYQNPQYQICPMSDTQLNLELNCDENYPLAIYVFESAGKSITEFDQETMNNVTTIRFLVKHMAFLSMNLKKKKSYLIVPSTFKPSQFGKFEMKLETNDKAEIIEKNNVKYKNKLEYQGSWSPATNKGPLGTATEFFKNPHLKITLNYETYVMIHLYASEPNVSVGLHLFEINEDKDRKLKKESKYSDIRMGAFIEDLLKKHVGHYEVYASCTDPSKTCDFFFEIYTYEKSDLIVEQMF